MYGTQTISIMLHTSHMFENDVKMYGTQTTNGSCRVHNRFENDVKMYGTQTKGIVAFPSLCLRMM